MKLYYWRGTGAIAALIRWATSSEWDHVALGIEIGGVECFIDSMPKTGVRLVPLAMDPPDSFQQVGAWTPARLDEALQLLGQPYDLADGFRAMLGLPPRCHGMNCAEVVAAILHMQIVPLPREVAREVERVTGNKVVPC